MNDQRDRSDLPAQIREMHESILRMGVLVEEALRKVIFALETRDFQLAEEIVRNDQRIDALEVRIDDQCNWIIATVQPEDRNLREVLTTLKFTTALERIGDHARHIARRARVITDSAFVPTLPIIRKMTENAISMLRDLLTAYVEGNADQAREVAARDDEIDRLHQQLTDQTVAIMRSDPTTIENGLELMLVNRFLERLGDQITNMCELVVFAGTADHVELNRSRRADRSAAPHEAHAGYRAATGMPVPTQPTVKTRREAPEV